MIITVGRPEEYTEVKAFYDDLIDAMENAEFKPGWEKDVYPSREMLEQALQAGELYIGREDGKIVACMIVNHQYNEGYHQVKWSVDVPDEKLLVIHALGVHPANGGRGLAKELVGHVIDLARKQGIKTIRLDVLGGNVPAEKAYTKMGFRYLQTLRMFYEDTGWTDYLAYEYLC